MISDSERRNVAANIRSAAERAKDDLNDDSNYSKIAVAYVVSCGIRGVPHYKDLLHLADLIDHPTCRNSADPYDDSSKQRHDAVDELRRAATGEYRHVDALDVIAGAVGVSISGKYMHDAEETVYGALADLIDRPTCHMVEVKTGEVADYRDADEIIFHCKSCHTERGIFSYDEDGNVYSARPEYCPNCGAKVVECDE